MIIFKKENFSEVYIIELSVIKVIFIFLIIESEEEEEEENKKRKKKKTMNRVYLSNYTDIVIFYL